jgi:hypothetical protein
MLKLFELHHIDGEILADNLLFEELPILFQAYQEWYGDGSVIACYRTVDGKKPLHKSRRDEFYQEWYELMDNLVTLNNI